MNANYNWYQGADPLSLAENLAGEVALKINAAIAEKGSAVIALSGGSTPKPLFEVLAECDIDWAKVVVTLVDERWVDESHELSNGAFMKSYLLNSLPDTVRFAPLYHAADSVSDSYQFVLNDYSRLTNSSADHLRAFDVVVLGMGSDGHTASFFPDAKNIAELVDPNTNKTLLSCHSPSTQVDRITWSLPVLLNTGFLALHITGEKKQSVFERAAKGGDAKELPIRAAIFQNRTPLNVYYAD